MKFIKFVPLIAVIAFVVLVILLKIHREPSVPETRRFVAKGNLQSLTLVNTANLDPRSPDETRPDITNLSDRYLLVSVDKDKEVRDEMLAPRAATALLSDAVAVSVTAGPATGVGNQLRTGDLVDVGVVSSTPLKKFEAMVLSPPTKDSSTILLAVSSGDRDNYAAALASSQLLITRKIAANKP